MNNSCWVPNKDFTDCIKINNLVDPLSEYCNSNNGRQECRRNCIGDSNYTLLKDCSTINEKLCTKIDCLNTCKELGNSPSCLHYCDTKKFFSESDYGYMMLNCGKNGENCKEKCKKAIQCRFNPPSEQTGPPNQCGIKICKDSCNRFPASKTPGDHKCNYFNNDYCYRFDDGQKKWKYTFPESRGFFKEKCGKIDNQLFLQSKTSDGLRCEINSNHCEWDCSDPKKPKKVPVKGLDPSKYKCYETKKNCCGKDKSCLKN